jgi:FkbM family methyltransferase
MLGLGKAKNALRTMIATHRRSAVVGAVHGLTSFIESAWRNEGSDFESNGEKFVLRRLQAAEFKLAIDAGANLGDWFCEALDLWPNCRVHAFEVAPETYKHLETRVASFPNRDRVTLHPFGVSDQAKSETLYYFPDNPQLTCDIPRHASYTSIPFEAKMITLDAFCADNGITSVDFLKIDVEGAEHRVLKGFKRYLDAGKVTCIQFEYGAFSIQTRFLLKDYYDLLSDAFFIGKIYPNSVEFGDYDWTTEDFRFSNYLCVSRKRPDLKSRLEK